MTGDRPAAELLAEWERLCASQTGAGRGTFRVENFDPVLHRLTRAENALAAVMVLANGYAAYGRRLIATDIEATVSAALRASQEADRG